MELTTLCLFGAISLLQCVLTIVLVFLFRGEKQELLRALIAKNLAELDQKDVSLEYYNTLKATAKKGSKWEKKQESKEEEGWIDASDAETDENVVSRVQISNYKK